MSAGRTRPADHEVRRRVAEEIDRCFVVEAGAGTGKTTLLVERALQILEQRAASLGEIALITFTEKAAGDLKVRLRQAIESRLREAPRASAPRSAALRKALEEIDRAAVSTIHAFAASLLRERPVETGLDPRFRVLDDLEAEILRDETFERFWVEALGRDDADLSPALRLGVSPRHIRALAMLAAENRDLGPPPHPPDGEAPASRLRRFRERVAELDRLAGDRVRAEDKGLEQIRRLARLARSVATLPGEAAVQRLLFEGRANARAGNASNWSRPDALKQAKELFSAIEEARQEGLERLGGEVAHRLGQWLDRFARTYEETLQRQGCLDFQGILLRARDLLRDDLQVRRYFQQRYRRLLVDEFQDTDPLQAEIVFYLSEDEPRAGSWTEARPGPGRLFIVGDSKQSIYRFRRADIAMYHRARAQLESSPGAQTAHITTNFRTVPGIVSWANGVFGRLIRPEYSAIDAHREALAPESPVSLLPLPEAAAPRADRADTARAVEGALVASLLRRAIGGREWRVHPRGLDPRPAAWGDVALLFRGLTGVEAFEEAFRARGVPYRVVGGRSFYLRQETRHLQAILRAIDNPHDALSVAAGLRSPFFGCSDEDLFLYAGGPDGGRFDYLRDAGRLPAGSPLDDAFRLLRDLHLRRHDRPAAATVEELLDGTGVLALLLLRPQGEQRVANLLKIADLARRHAAAGGGSFRSFVRFVSSMEEEERRESESPTVEEEDDVVRLMSVHQAKGLEFPIVVLADAAGAPGSGDGFILDRDRGVYHFTLPLGERGQETLGSWGHQDVKEREKALAAEEMARLLYVAATRARDHLIVPIVPHGGREGPFLKLLREAGALPGEPARPGPGPLPGSRVLDSAALDATSPSVSAFRFPDLDDDAGLAPDEDALRERMAWREGLTRALEVAGRGRPVRTASGLEGATFEPGMVVGGPGAPARTGASRQRRRAIGIAVHAVLESLPPVDPRPDRARLRAAAAGLELGLTPAEAAEVARLAEAACRTSLPGRLARARRYQTEMPFAVPLSAGHGSTVLLEGRIDLLIEEAAGCVVVDYKSDLLPRERAALESAIAEKTLFYRPQAASYAAALAALGARVTSALLIFLDAGREEAIPVDAAFLELGRRVVFSDRPDES